MNKYKLLVIFLAPLFFYSCKKNINVNLNDAPAEIVIQGEVTDSAGPYTVTLNESVNYNADNNFPAVSGASVIISDNQGVVDSLSETSAGIYTTHLLQGKQGNTYTLTVAAQNKTYTAVSTMPLSVPFDSVSFNSSGIFGKKRINAVANFQDPVGTKNYYQFIEYINGEQFTNDIFVFDDRLSDGKYINFNLRMDSSYLNVGDKLEVKMNCVDENIYNYFFQLGQSSGTGTFSTTASPANPETNLTNGALGYFSAHTTQSKVATIQ